MWWQIYLPTFSAVSVFPWMQEPRAILCFMSIVHHDFFCYFEQLSISEPMIWIKLHYIKLSEPILLNNRVQADRLFNKLCKAYSIMSNVLVHQKKIQCELLLRIGWKVVRACNLSVWIVSAGEDFPWQCSSLFLEMVSNFAGQGWRKSKSIFYTT